MVVRKHSECFDVGKKSAESCKWFK